MNTQRRALTKILILLPLAVISSALAIGPGGLVSYTPATRVGVHSVLAFWISIPAALVLLSYQRKPLRAHVLLMSALVFSIVLHIGSAAKNTFILSQPSVDRLLINTVADFVDLVLFSVLFAGSCLCFSRQVPFEEQKRINRFVLPTLFLAPLIIFGAIWFYIFPLLSTTDLVLLSWILGVIAIVALLLSSLIIPKIKQDDLPVDAGYLVSAILLFVVSTVVLLLTVPTPSLFWELAETLQMAGFLLFCIALGVPYLKRNGFTRSSSYSLNIGLIMIAYFPFLVTIGIESMSVNYLVEAQNLLAYSIIHTGAGSLSGLMAILLFIYPKKKTSWNQYPLILIFGVWASIAFFTIFSISFPALSPLGEPITPYTIGSILTLSLLCFAIWWTINPPSEETEKPTILQLLGVLSVLVISIISGEMINQLVLRAYPSFMYSPIGSILIQIVNLIIMFTFALLIFLLASRSRGKPSIELFVVIFLAMWILPNILKSYYHIWFTGWWVSEIYLFAGSLAGTMILAWLYLRSIYDVMDSHAKAGMYADLLMHDITNFNQMMMTSFELLGSDDTSEEQRVKLSEDGCQVISLAEQMISNVRLLSETDRLKELQLSQMNLVSTIIQALDLFGRRIGPGELSVEFNPSNAEAFVLANDLLMHIYLNILYSFIDCYYRDRTVAIEINEIIHDGEVLWKTTIVAPCRKHQNKHSYSSGILGITAARTITESLNGELSVKEIEQDDDSIQKIYSVYLPATEE